MLSDLQEQERQNKEIIRKLIDFEKKFKQSQKEKIEQLELEIIKFEGEFKNSQKQISEYNSSIDDAELMNLYRTLNNKSSLREAQQKLQGMLCSIQQHQLLFESNNILSKFPIITYLNLSNENNSYLQKIYNCSIHKETIIGVDLSQNQSKLDDFVCPACITQNIPPTKLDGI